MNYPVETFSFNVRSKQSNDMLLDSKCNLRIQKAWNKKKIMYIFNVSKYFELTGSKMLDKLRKTKSSPTVNKHLKFGLKVYWL